MNLEEEIRMIGMRTGADRFGIADLSSATDAIRKQGGTLVAGYPRAISIGVTLIHPIVSLLAQNSRSNAILYRHHTYDVISTRIDQILSQVAGLIQQAGYAAFPIPSSRRTDNDHIASVFSHKLAAHCAGLGWIGKNSLLITPDPGPRVRWGTVLTNAPLSPTGGPMNSRCGSCTTCVEICPVGAITGEPFREEDSRDIRLDARKCDRYHASLEKEGKEAVCGLCLYVCPYGKREAEQIQVAGE